MIKVLFVSQRADKSSHFEELFQKLRYDFVSMSDETMISDYMSATNCEIVILDTLSKGIKFSSLLKRIKPMLERTALLLLIDKDFSDKELIKNANALIEDDMNDSLISGIVSMNLRMRTNLEKLSETNQDLADSNYRLNALYTTSSQFAGSLDKEKLIQYMLEGMDKALSYSLTCTLSFCTEDEPVLLINSLYGVSDELADALKMRIILHYKSLFEGQELPYEVDIKTLKVKKFVKYPANRFNFSIFQFDNMFSKISLGDNFFGCVEIFKETPFSTENATCFQTIAQQVSLPLKSATLYQELKDTNKKLERLERLKSEFISIVSHELRTPLTSIKNSLEIMSSDKCREVTETYNKFLDMAKRNSQRLSEMINNLLDLSKIEACKMDFHFKDTDINSVINYVKSSIALPTGQQIITIEGENLPQVYADSQRLEQVLTNLVSNAVKFTPEGKSITIKSEFINSSDLKYPEIFEETMSKLNGNYVMVSVSDEGIGISQDNLLHVFDKFAQIENSLSRKVGGSGLGLPIAKQLIEAHKGAIWCDSEPDKGSTFSFVVPVIE
ncbi:MAG: ATP-binding protein [Candidatus Gastranaerophilaceae bacterium]|nr:ATP-binding protein [Candidatus Gastranaerophilaceae bacterium]